jgi:primosomal protein N' (replication factor Y) (superfamily II helicase)
VHSADSMFPPETTLPPQVVDVLLPVALDRLLSYRLPDGLSVRPGDHVTVPLGTRDVTGVVWGFSETVQDHGKLKAVIRRHDWPPMSAAMRGFLDWIAAYTMGSRGLVLRLAMRDPEGRSEPRLRFGLRRTQMIPDKPTAQRQRVLALAADGLVRGKAELARESGVSTAVVDALVDLGALEAVALLPSEIVSRPEPDHVRVTLSKDQANAAQAFSQSVQTKAFSVSLLEGVTGSGKTEVYFEAVAEALRQGRQALILMPEIALTSEFRKRFENRFGAEPAEWHSGIAAGRKDRIWQGVADGSVPVVAGARSALFMPFSALGLIIVDEEHEQAYKQEDGVFYHARDMAVIRARQENAAIILASATPSVESRVNASAGRYAHLRLPDRHGGRSLPKLAAIDLKHHAPPRGRFISDALATEVRKTLAEGQQALLFLNRRGYAPLTLCRHCGHRWKCPHCSAWLVEHRFRRALVCHHCGHTERSPHQCEACGEADSLTACGPGVERLAEEAATLFPDTRMIVLSSDFPGGTERLRRELSEIAEGTFQLVIGTQLVAKGHNFPGLALVGVIDADIGLTSGDPRACERTFQLLQQVTGRAGRGGVAGRGLVQTYDPVHPVMKAILSGDQEGFYREEIAMRQRAGLPPFGRMAGIVVSSKDKALAEGHARALARTGHALLTTSTDPRITSLMLLGPAEAPIALLRGRHRVRLLVKGPREAEIQRFLKQVMATAEKATKDVRVTIDIDPMSFL